LSGHTACKGNVECIKKLFGNPHEKRPVCRRWCRCEDKVKMDFKDIWSVGVDWIDRILVLYGRQVIHLPLPLDFWKKPKLKERRKYYTSLLIMKIRNTLRKLFLYPENSRVISIIVLNCLNVSS
jgi:hypothetical protein